ncbi:hypothetical protein HDU67_008648 [Dinochytrium kinnereticum]|nr:hypothetical protein HDU67_008648 [Dinochytrium kinnereticum]
MGHIIQLTILMTHYLGVRVPFELVNKGAKSVAKGNSDCLPRIEGFSSGYEFSQMPLYLTDSNIDAFTAGLAMLNFDIAFICYSQGVIIPIHNIPNTLENLALCCRASCIQLCGDDFVQTFGIAMWITFWQKMLIQIAFWELVGQGMGTR